jgi:hypothetical protein
MPGPRPSAGHVADQHPLIGADDREPRLRRRLTLSLQKPLRSCQPAAHRCHERSVEQQVHRHADGRARCRDLITGLHGRRVGAPPGLDGHIEMAGRIGDLAKHREVRVGQKAVCVRFHEEVEGLPPVVPGGRVTCALDEAKTSAIAHRTPPQARPNPGPGATGPERNREGYRRNSLPHASREGPRGP